jgi:pimeloyl-ACP methyl ester carboxylesterase
MTPYAPSRSAKPGIDIDASSLPSFSSVCPVDLGPGSSSRCREAEHFHSGDKAMNRLTLAFAILALPALPRAGETAPSSEATGSLYNRIFLVGHDIGFLLAYAYAAARPDEVRRLVLFEGVLPAIADRDKIKLGDLFWHFRFHSVPNLREALVADPDRLYPKTAISNPPVRGSRAVRSKRDQI